MSEIIQSGTLARLGRALTVRCPFITDLAWSPDGATLAVAHGMGVWLWRGDFAAAPTQRIEHDAPIKAIAFSPDGRWLALGSADSTLMGFDAHTLAPEFIIGGYQGAVSAVTFSPDSSATASGAGDGFVRVTQLDGTLTAALKAHSAEITGLVYLDETRLLSAGWDSPARLWNLATPQDALLGAFPHADWIRALAKHPTQPWVAAAGKDGRVQVWNADTRREIAAFAAHERGIDAIAFSPDGALLATGGRDGVLRLWALGEDAAQTAGEIVPVLLREFPTAHDKPILALAFHPQGTFLTTGGGDNTVALWGVK